MHRTPDRQELSHGVLSNLSLSQYSWDRQQNGDRRMTTDEDVLCSYSKLSNVSPIRDSIGILMEESKKTFNDTRKEHGQLFQRTRRSSQKVKLQLNIEESINLNDELQREAQADKIRIVQLTELVQEKDQQIQQLEEYQVWLHEQNEKMMKNQQLMIEDQLNGKDNEVQKQKNDLHIQQLEQSITQTEQQLHKSLQNLGMMEKENSLLRTQLIEYEKRLFQQEHQESYTIQLIDELKSKNNEIQSQYNAKLIEFQKYFAQQDAYINKLEKDVQLSRKSSKETVNKQYKSVILREKSPQQAMYDHQQMVKFVECIVDMVMNCSQADPQDKPNLKKCWKWLKNILEDYMALKKNYIQDAHDIHKRFQTSVDDFENKSFRSNTLLTKLSK